VKSIRACALAAATAGLLASAPSAAQTQAATAPVATNQKAVDRANEVVCERQEITGSRLGTRRVCMTRAQWADLRLQDRQEIEKAQTRRGMKGE
jgi:hypothetical protein